MVAKRVSSLAQTDIIAGMELGAPLPNQDATGGNELTVGTLQTKALRAAIATVA